MSDDLAVLVPLKRPQHLDRLVTSLTETTPGAHLVLLERDGTYAEKINRGYWLTNHDFVFFGADDLLFHPGWFDAAIARLTNGAQVVGVNDLIRRDREHATHFLVRRDFTVEQTIDGEQGPLCTAYHHWYVDDELIGTATKRGVYAYAEDSVVQHFHPMNDPELDDEVYRAGRAKAKDDRYTFRRRRPLWT